MIATARQSGRMAPVHIVLHMKAIFKHRFGRKSAGKKETPNSR
jgi:hypothetical protein